MAAEVLAPAAPPTVNVREPTQIPSPVTRAEQKSQTPTNVADYDNDKYRALVIDSGPIIKLTGVSALRDRAQQFYTVPAVLEEIRDAKARSHLEQLPFDIVTRHPSPEGVHAVTEFSRLTGDYPSLSLVDLQVLALLYDLEKEGCLGSMEHVRTTPKRTVGGGKVELLGQAKQQPQQEPPQKQQDGVNGQQCNDDHAEKGSPSEESKVENAINQATLFFDGETAAAGNDNIAQGQPSRQSEPQSTSVQAQNEPKTWAILVNPVAAIKPVETELHVSFQQTMMLIEPQVGNTSSATDAEVADGQFCDADEGDEKSGSTSSFDSNEDISDEDCNVYILDPDETKPTGQDLVDLEQELQSDFPSLAGSLQVPYEGDEDGAHHHRADEDGFTDEQRKHMALQPISKSGNLYNSFRGYKKLFHPAQNTKKLKETAARETPPLALKNSVIYEEKEGQYANPSQSRIMGGMTMSGQEVDVEDDGEGWITCTRDIRSIQTTGSLAPSANDGIENLSAQNGPPLCQRTACATTDFAMQNVILQMNLELLSVDGVKIRRIKNWVIRCGACFHVYTNHDDTGPHGMKRLFCERCGSDMLQRIAASVDGKTGRLRLHMSKKHKNNLRGTKYSLPKPGTGDRFQGDLLLREDQLLTGAWNQKVKIRSGGKARSAAQSMFGQDIAANVGCSAQSMRSDDIHVGFGRRNPNAAKGRERRGKKKKSAGKACGLRRYT